MNPKIIRNWNKYRSMYNPLRGLTINRAVGLLEAHERGEYCDVMWTFRYIERMYPTLVALIERRTSAIMELDYSIKTVPVEKDTALAAEQEAALREAYDRIDNLYEAFEHLAMATFREFAHVEKHRDRAGEIVHLEILDQWNVVRSMGTGQWKYNPDAMSTSFDALPETALMDMNDFIFRSVPRPVDPIAMLAFIRSNMSQKDWDAFVETYGIPPLFIIMPPNVPQGKEAEYQGVADDVAGDGRGALPNGSDVKSVDVGARAHPFADHMRHLQEEVVLAGTGGLLTMLTAPGSGTLAGNAHKDTFEKIAKSEARKISEAFQKQFDAEILGRAFPGKPVLAYFDLAANEETDVGEIITHASNLYAAGYQVDKQILEEKTGYTLIPAPVAPPGLAQFGSIANRGRVRMREAPVSDLLTNGITELARAQREDLAALADELIALYRKSESEDMTIPQLFIELVALRDRLPEHHKKDPLTAQIFADLQAAAWANGIMRGADV